MAEPAELPPDLPLTFPWHAPLIKQIESTWLKDRLPHAVLLHGHAGLGKRRLAEWIARGLLCDSKRDHLTACGRCNGCRLVAAGSHPDLKLVTPEEGKQQLSVDQVRAVSEWLAMTSHQQGWKIAIIDPAQMMTIAAANSLLKTLEEPPARSLLILVASSLQGLPATLRSRCQRLGIPRPPAAMALKWLTETTSEPVAPQVLEFTGGAPLRALEVHAAFARLDEEMRASLTDLLAGRADVTRVAQFWAKEALPDRLAWLDLWLMSLAREAVAETSDLVTFPGQPVPLPTSGNVLNISHLYRLADRIRELKSQLLRTALNRDLAAEMLIAELLTVFTRRQP
ncbi:MAG: DNA polymerase III subunit delta' [Steroidobacteraceae bacterium]